MSQDFLSLELPEKYTENLIEFHRTLDGVPEWPDFANAGWSMQEYYKFTKLYAIESMKYHLVEAMQDEEISSEEKAEADKLIEVAIQEYNEMN